jgi:hypothetical protein
LKRKGHDSLSRSCAAVARLLLLAPGAEAPGPSTARRHDRTPLLSSGFTAAEAAEPASFAPPLPTQTGSSVEYVETLLRMFLKEYRDKGDPSQELLLRLTSLDLKWRTLKKLPRRFYIESSRLAILVCYWSCAGGGADTGTFGGICSVCFAVAALLSPSLSLLSLLPSVLLSLSLSLSLLLSLGHLILPMAQLVTPPLFWFGMVAISCLAGNRPRLCVLRV